MIIAFYGRCLYHTRYIYVQGVTLYLLLLLIIIAYILQKHDYYLFGRLLYHPVYIYAQGVPLSLLLLLIIKTYILQNHDYFLFGRVPLPPGTGCHIILWSLPVW